MSCKLYSAIIFAVCGMVMPSIVFAGMGNKITLAELINKIVRNYPSLDVAAIQIERARQEFAKVESQLGWVLTAQGGYLRDITFIDSPTDHYEAGVGFNKKLESGSSIEIVGVYTRDDSKVSFSPFTPNPADRTRLDLKYRIPLSKGEGNISYSTGMINAQSQLAIQNANQRLIIDNLIQQSMLLYYDSLLTSVRINDAKNNIKRTRRLLDFVNKNKRLGLSEEKDILRVQSQLGRHVALHDSLLVVWNQQKSELNKLIGEPPSFEFEPVLQTNKGFDINNKNDLLIQVFRINPELNSQKGHLQSAEAEIVLARDARRNKLDLVLSVGARKSSGDTATGSTSIKETAGGAQIEYRYDLDKRGFDASLYQALLKKEQVSKEILRIKQDLKYKLDGLLSQYKANIRAVNSNLEYFKIEKRKIEDAYKRYREGRSTTNEIIDYEDALQASHLLHQNQSIALSRNLSNIALFIGNLWNNSSLDEKINKLEIERPVK